MGYILVSRRRGSNEVELLTPRLYRQRSEAYDGFMSFMRDVEDTAGFTSERDIHIVEVSVAGRVFTFAYPTAETALAEEATGEVAPSAIVAGVEVAEGDETEEAAAVLGTAETLETVELAEDLTELESDAGLAEAAPEMQTAAEGAPAEDFGAGWPMAPAGVEEPVTEEAVTEEAAVEAPALEGPPLELAGGVSTGAELPVAAGEEPSGLKEAIEAAVEEPVWGEPAPSVAPEEATLTEVAEAPEAVAEPEVAEAPEAAAEPQAAEVPQAVPEAEPAEETETAWSAGGGAADLAAAWEAAAAEETVAPTAEWATPSAEAQAWPTEIEDIEEEEAGSASWGWTEHFGAPSGETAVAEAEAPVAETAAEAPVVETATEAPVVETATEAPVAETAPEAPVMETAAETAEMPVVGEPAAEEVAPEAPSPEEAWSQAGAALLAPETDFAAPKDLADTLGIQPDEEANGGYTPESPLDLSVYTCQDCIFYDTCPKRGQEEPANCGSFQWRAGL